MEKRKSELEKAAEHPIMLKEEVKFMEAARKEKKPKVAVQEEEMKKLKCPPAEEACEQSR